MRLIITRKLETVYTAHISTNIESQSATVYVAPMNHRQFSLLDHLIAHVDNGVRTLFGENHATRPNPAVTHSENELSSAEKQLAGRLMRINHAGEVAAQGLYQGQALTAKLPNVREQMEEAAQEEVDHLAWCKTRTKELGTHTSLLDPIWYIGSVTIGAVAGLAGDKWSLGFVTETERQVVKHLESHLEQLPQHDEKSRAILEQMKIDEQHHATTALEAGAAELPTPIKNAMTLTSKIMTKAAYWV
ncbi:2-polyprenyl-3-methyl-6-methoxy-1,4-benzoquinone monooxygenase [Kaarinaea lacus]